MFLPILSPATMYRHSQNVWDRPVKHAIVSTGLGQLHTQSQHLHLHSHIKPNSQVCCRCAAALLIWHKPRHTHNSFVTQTQIQPSKCLVHTLSWCSMSNLKARHGALACQSQPQKHQHIENEGSNWRCCTCCASQSGILLIAQHSDP